MSELDADAQPKQSEATAASATVEEERSAVAAESPLPVDSSAPAEASPIVESEADGVPAPEPSDPGSRGRARGSARRQPGPAEDVPEPMRGPRTVGRFIADALRTAGVRYAFTVPGESFLGLLDAFEGAGIRVIATRHEGAAAFMAEAHGQLTGRPAVCLGTRAVGGANLAIGIHTARQNSTPMFVAVGQVERQLLGREAFQEIDQVATLGGLAKWAAEPLSVAEIGPMVSEAIRQALGGRPGPAFLVGSPRTSSTRRCPTTPGSRSSARRRHARPMRTSGR